MKNVDQMSLSELREWYLSQGWSSTGIDALIRAAKRDHHDAVVRAIQSEVAIGRKADLSGDRVALAIIGAVNLAGEKL